MGVLFFVFCCGEHRFVLFKIKLIYGFCYVFFLVCLFEFVQGSPELLEVKMGTDGYSDGSDDNNRDIDNENSVEVCDNLIFYFHR